MKPLKLNFAPIKFKEKDYSLYLLPYESEEQLKQLRQLYNATNSFFRYGDTIYHSPMVEEEGYRQGTLRNFSVDEPNTQHITKSLIHHTLFRWIFSNNIVASSFHPIEFMSRLDKDNILRTKIPEEFQSKIAYRKGIKIDTRVLVRNQKPIYGVLFDTYHRWDINIPCDELHSKGIDLTGLFVVADDFFSETLKPKRSLKGAVISIEDSTAIIQGDGEELKLSLSGLYLENGKHNRRKILEKYLSSREVTEIEKFVFRTAGKRRGAEGRAISLNPIYKSFLKKSFGSKNIFEFKITEFFDSGSDLWQSKKLHRPTYFFNASSTESNALHDKGLDYFGPYSKSYFSPSKPVIAVVCREESYGQFSVFINKLKDGISLSNTKNPFQKGMLGKYHLHDIQFSFHQFKNPTPIELNKVIQEVLTRSPNASLAIIESTNKYFEFQDSQNPYFFLKAKFLSRGIPSQEFRIETISKKDKNLAYVLNTACLAMYAKMGGTPWRIHSKRSHREIIIGIGNSVIKSSRFRSGNRYVGISSFFSEFGEYLLSNKTQECEYENYFEGLKSSLLSSIKGLGKKQNWEKGETVLINFHLFKPLKDNEIEVIEELVVELKQDFDVLFSYLTFNKRHPYLVFDPNQQGKKDWARGGRQKGKWQPIRGVNLQIDDHESVIFFTGIHQVKTADQGYAQPVLLKLHEKSTFKDLGYLAQQAFNFTANSYRGFHPISLPVTIDYATQISRLLSKMKRVEGFDSNALFDPKMNNKLWFL